MSKPLQIYVGDTPLLIDFEALRVQKAYLIDINPRTPLEADYREGLLNFIDEFQDACAEALGEGEVFR
jgi:hypothetical protein